MDIVQRHAIFQSCHNNVKMTKYFAKYILHKIRTDTQIKYYKAVARPIKLYGSETWVTTKRDRTRLEAVEMCFL